MTNDGLHRNAIGAALALLAWLGGAAIAAAADLSVRVTAKDGAPVAGVAVYAVPIAGPTERGGAAGARRIDRTSRAEGEAAALTDAAASHSRTHAPAEHAPKHAPAEAVMDQRDHAFVPHVLIIETGTLVHFPNNDSVSHHVYSFSPTRPFELPLYRGTFHAPLPFDTPGLVALGCNIHDDMLGYILVVDTPYFGKTDVHGVVLLDDLPEGTYSVDVWTPRLSPRALPQAEQVTVTRAARESLAFAFAERLFPAHDDSESTLTWYQY